MKKKILSYFAIISIFSSQSICLANDNSSYQFDPVIQGVPQAYQTQYPLPDLNRAPNRNDNYNQNNVPVNNVYQPPVNNYNNDRLQGNVVMVPAKTSFSAVLMTPVSSETAKAGDSISMFLGSDFYYGNYLIAPAGSKIFGSVIKANKGGIGNRNGKLQIRFNNLSTPNGQIIPIAAGILTDDGSGILKAGTAMDTTKEYAKKAAIGAASGAVLGVVMGALSGGKVGKGAIYGTAVGGGMGLVQPMFERGDNVVLPQNAQLDIVLDQPLTISTSALSY